MLSMLLQYYPGIHLYKVRKTIKYLRIVSAPVKIRPEQHLNTDCNGHVNLLGSTDDRGIKINNFFFVEDLNGRDHLQK